MQGWSNVDSARSREVGQRFRYAPWDIPRIHRVLGVRPGMRIVDVGCGGGYFSRLLTEGLRHVGGGVIGFDSDEGMIEEGRKLNEEQGVSDRCTLKVGDIYDLPMPNDAADLVVCHVVLCNLVDRLSAIREMRRVVKPRGTVAALEPAHLRGSFDPDRDERLEELQSKLNKAIGAYIEELRGERVDGSPEAMLRLPQLFMEAGLEHVRLESFDTAFLLCDDRYRDEEIVAYYRERMDVSEQEKRGAWFEIALERGCTAEEVEEAYKRQRARWRQFVDHPEKVKQTPLVEVSVNLLVMGKKPEKAWRRRR